MIPASGPQQFYTDLVAGYGALEYVAPPLDESLLLNLLSKMGFGRPSAKTLRGLRQLAPAGRTPITSHLAESVWSVLPVQDRQRLDGRVFVADFPTGTLNAHAKRVPDGSGYVFLLNVGLMNLLYDAVKIVFSQTGWARFDKSHAPIPGTETGGHEVEFAEAAKLLQKLVREYVQTGQWHSQPGHFFLTDEKRNLFVAELVLSAERFVLAHEFEHALLGHLDRDETDTVDLPARPQFRLLVANKSQEEELAADMVAGAGFLLGLPRRAADPDAVFHAHLALAGPFVFLELLRQTESAAGVVYRTHPPTKDRARALRELFKTKLPESAFGLSDALVEMLRRLS